MRFRFINRSFFKFFLIFKLSVQIRKLKPIYGLIKFFIKILIDPFASLLTSNLQ